MSSNFPKLASWGGRNKSRVRLFKKYEIQTLVQQDSTDFERPAGWKPSMLTFSGPDATLERLLVNHKLVKPSDITTIQTYERLSEGHFGEPLLKKLIRTRSDHLSGMRIWPHNFESFSQCYTNAGCSHPSVSSQARWSKSPFKKFMDQIVDEKVKKFSVMDLDLCGIFSHKNSESVLNLFENKVVEHSGVMFLTHQKGRDVRGGALFKVLNDYLKNCPYIDYDKIYYIDDPKKQTYVARFILIPLYYICKAYELGYALELNRLIEYRDCVDGPAVNMLQYFFKWYNIDWLESPTEVARDSMASVMADSYPHLKWID